MTNPPQPGDLEPAPRRARILVVDDHDLGRRSLARLLDAYGFEVVAAADGRSALDALKAQPGFDFLLTDVRLPDLDGREVVCVARALTPRPRIGLITGWDVDPDESDRLEIDWVFLKPLNVQEIVEKLRQALAIDPSTSG